MRLSVIIPSYNRETLIGETILNLLGQTRPPDEIIVVDDGSMDKSVEVIKSFGEKVKLIQQANQGPGAARNAGLQMATGELVQFQDSDDLFSLNKLEAQAQLIEQTGADIAFGPWVKARIEGRRLMLEDHVLQQKMPPLKLPLACWWLRGWSTVFQSLLFRRSFLDRIGPYRTDMNLGEDGELFFRAMTSSPKAAFNSEALTLYRLHETNKLTRDEGASRSRRDIDWARCLQLTMSRVGSTGLKTDLMTRSFFLSGVRKHLAYLRTASDAPAELVKSLSDPVGQMPWAWLSAVSLGKRLEEQARLRLRGSRWMTPYQASKPTSWQLKLIADLGFQIISPPSVFGS